MCSGKVLLDPMEEREKSEIKACDPRGEQAYTFPHKPLKTELSRCPARGRWAGGAKTWAGPRGCRDRSGEASWLKQRGCA